MGSWLKAVYLVVPIAFVLGIIAGPLRSQVIQFESNGLKYQTLTKGNVTIMFAIMPSHIRDYSVLQVAVSNGSPVAWIIKPEDFKFHRHDGEAITPSSAREVVNSLIEKASRGDVIKLVTAYEAGIYGNPNLKSFTNGYESRRRSALAEVSSAKIKAAAAASAIGFVQTKLNPGQSVDGAVFYPTNGKPLGPGHLVIEAAGETFEFLAEP